MDDDFSTLVEYLRSRIDAEEAEALGARNATAEGDLLHTWAIDRLNAAAARRAMLDMESEFSVYSELYTSRQTWEIAVCRLAQQYAGREDWRTEWTR